MVTTVPPFPYWLPWVSQPSLRTAVSYPTLSLSAVQLLLVSGGPLVGWAVDSDVSMASVEPSGEKMGVVRVGVGKVVKSFARDTNIEGVNNAGR